MTQLEALTNIVKTFDDKRMAIIFLGDWLEDINFHSEAAEVRGWLHPIQQEWYEDLAKLNIARKQTYYSVSHYQYLKEQGYTTVKHEHAVEVLRGERGLVFFGDNHYTDNDLRNMALAEDMQRGMSYIWGWGVDNDLYPDKKTFLETLKKLVELE